ncbi:sensor histidine kinase [Herminiimonas aquatilis]|uniref:histidine kinase n=1 Tax=Herminiimonas aquatilis TaxID=345342 RepID=A0ABW2J5C5_9BURK
MTSTNAKNITSAELSATSLRMLELRDAVLNEWQARMRATISKAAGLSQPILVNTMPVVYANLAEAITPDYARNSNGVLETTVAAEHGNERARLTNYDLSTVISEYQVLRLAIFDVLAENGLHLTETDMRIINMTLDATIKESATAFSLVQSAFRERFVATLAHDLRSPLNAVQMFAERIGRTSDPKVIGELSDKIKQNVGRMDRMIRELLDIVVFEQGERLKLHLTNFNIMQVVRQVCDESFDIYGSRFEVVGEDVTGWWGRDALQRALENLIGNALKYGSKDTPITIKIDHYHGRILISVHNEGNPIPPDQLESVFQVFERAKIANDENEQGWGLGLPFVRSVAESHGGSIVTDSSPDAGTTFIIDIPIDARPFLDAPTLQQIQ